MCISAAMSLMLFFLCVPRVEEDDTALTSTSSLPEKAEVCWGLSSSCNLAKDLLPDALLQVSESEENVALNAAATVYASKSAPNQENGKEEDTEKDEIRQTSSATQPLSKVQAKKLKQLLLKIQDEKLCKVCMDELISSVFCPCGHHVACFRCAKRLDKCPVCRQPTGHVQYVYTK